MRILDERVERYIHGLQPERSEVMAEMEGVADRDGVPIVHWETGRFLAVLCRTLDPVVLEVGTAIGYSTLHMARELGPDGRIFTLERDPQRISQALGFWARGGVADRIELVAGDALESLERLPGPFDLVFLDAGKTEIDAYLERLDGRVAPHAMLVVDNLLMSGEAALPEGLDTSWGEESLRAARATTRSLMESREWLFSLLPVGDGVGLGARRGSVRA